MGQHPLKDLALQFLAGLAILFVLAVVVNAQPVHDHSTMGVTGEFYSKWQIPPKRQSSCCSERDCYVTTILQVDGKWVYLSRATKKYEPLPVEKLEEMQSDPFDSPDGQSHVCELAGTDELGSGNYTTVLCAVRGMGQ